MQHTSHTDYYMLIESIIIASAHLAQVSPAALLSVCSVESNLISKINVQDYGSASYGPCQVKLATARLIDPSTRPVKLWLDASYSSLIAARYLAKQLKRYHGNLHQAILAYNAGTFKGTKTSRTNREYLKRVLKRMEFYESAFITH